MSLKNLIVKGKYSVVFSETPDLDHLRELFDKIKQNIQVYLSESGYQQTSPDSLLHNYANMEFYPIISASTLEPIKKSWFWVRRKPRTNLHLDQLNRMKKAAPWHVSVSCYPGQMGDKHLIVVEITSEPSIIHQYQQLHIAPILNQDDIDLIVYENEEFIARLAKANLLNTLEKPKPLGSFIKTEVALKLRTFDFNEIADLLEKSRKEIEGGKSENGLVDLRSAIELFFVRILERKGEKAAPQKDINKNIDKLHGLRYIDTNTHKILMKLAYNGLYTNLSEITHDRISRDYFDSRFQLNITEQIFDYLLDRVIKLNIRTE